MSTSSAVRPTPLASGAGASALPRASSLQLSLYLIFFIGGMPALIYQVVWQRVLTLYFGVDIYSTSITISTFMLGLGVGSLIGGRLADRVTHVGLCYAAAEILMGAFGFVSLPLFSWTGAWLGGGSLATVMLGDFLLLLVPTTLMGTTLPLMCRMVIGNDPGIGRHLSWLYGVNTLGAAVGALLSSYFLIGLFGLDGTTYVAAILNIALAVVVFALTRSRAKSDAAPVAVVAEVRSRPAEPVADGAVYRYAFVLAFSFLSGFTSLGYEIVWYRLLGILLHSTVYVFGTILFFFLAAMAVGSVLARRHIDKGQCIERFARCQLAISAYQLVLFGVLGYLSWLPPFRQIIAASFFSTFHPAPELAAGTIDVYSLYSIADVAGWSILIVGVPAALMGYGFTNLMREGTQRVEQVGRSVSGIYFVNIVGSTLGSLVIGFVLIHYLGSENALSILVALGCLAPAILHGRLVSPEAPSLLSRLSGVGMRPVAIGVAVLALTVFPGRTQILKAMHLADFPSVQFEAVEDRTGVSALRTQSAVIAFEQEELVIGTPRLYIDGSHHGDASPTVKLVPDEAVQIALAAPPSPRRVLSIGLGDAQMAGTAALSPDVQELVIVELNGTLTDILGRTEPGRMLLGSEKVKYVVDDGRRWLLANPNEKFDAILMFPLHAAHAFSGNLYSHEFLELLSRHLTPGGVVFLRTVDLYSTARTLGVVFPNVLRLDTSIYMASMSPFRFDPARLPVSPERAVQRMTADRATIMAHTQDARVNSDLKPNSEYYVTYPYVQALASRGNIAPAYRATDTERFRSLIAEREHVAP